MNITSALLFPAMLVSAVAIIAVTTRSLERDRRVGFLREVVFIMAAFFVYFATRGATEGSFDEALSHARQVEDLERWLGIFVEPRMQDAILDHRWLVEAANLIYIWAHWPVIAAVAIWLYRTRPKRYFVMRNAVLISGAVGLVIFALYPTAPPRLAGLEVVDTVVQRSDYYKGFQPSFLSNQYAAVPSLHVGWSVLLGVALIRESGRPLLQVAGVLVPLVMTWAVIVTANHYVLDGVAGAALSLGALMIAERRAA